MKEKFTTNLKKLNFQEVYGKMESGKEYSEIELKNLFNETFKESFICNDFFKNTILKKFRNEVSGLAIKPRGNQRLYIKSADPVEVEPEPVQVSGDETHNISIDFTGKQWRDVVFTASIFKKWNSVEIPEDIWKEETKLLPINSPGQINRLFEKIRFEERLECPRGRGDHDKKFINLSHTFDEIFNVVIETATKNNYKISPSVEKYLNGEKLSESAPTTKQEPKPAVEEKIEKTELKKPFKPLCWEDAFIVLSVFMVQETEEVSFTNWMKEISLISKPSERQDIIRNANNVFSYLGLPLVTINDTKVSYGGDPKESYGDVILAYHTFSGKFPPERVQLYLNGEIKERPRIVETPPVVVVRKPEVEAKEVQTETIVLVSSDDRILRLARKSFNSSSYAENVITFPVKNSKEDLVNLFKLMMDIELSNNSKILGALNSEGTLLKRVQEKINEINKAFD